MKNHIEDDNQEALITWCRLNESKYPQLGNIFAIPNGGKRNIREAVRFKRQGVKAGVPDLFLASKGKFKGKIKYGLFIELKAPHGRINENQNKWIIKLDAQNYGVVVRFSFEEAVKAICEYLDIPYKL